MQKIKIIKTDKEIYELIEYLKDKDFVAFDTETTGLKLDTQIVGMSVSAEIDVGFYVIRHYWNVQAEDDDEYYFKNGTLEEMTGYEANKALLEELQNHSLIMHNAIFDVLRVEHNYGVKLMDAVHTDTMILAHLLDENRSCALKELAYTIYGESAIEEQKIMKASVLNNGGELTKKNYELYKADSDLLAEYGAKDAILTLSLFYHMVPELYEQGLDKFFYEEESMPLLRGPTYELNKTGLKVDIQELDKLKRELETEILELKGFIYKEIGEISKGCPLVKKSQEFNIESSKQRSWLLFIKLDQEFFTLTKEGKKVAKHVMQKLPYAPMDKRYFIQLCSSQVGEIFDEGVINLKTGKVGRPKKVKEAFNYIACGKDTIGRYAQKYKWCEALLKLNQAQKLLSTYVMGIKERLEYGIIHPEFLQTGTNAGRYSSKNPNFQNLPRTDKRVKKCIIAREGKVLVGADQEQIEPRVFASISNDERLLASFANKDDFYSVIGMRIFKKNDCTAKKEDKNGFAKKYPHLRDIAKIVALGLVYGMTDYKLSIQLGKPKEECKRIIDDYLTEFPGVYNFMLNSYEQVKNFGEVRTLFGRPRRLPEALKFNKLYGKSSHDEYPYEARKILNIAVNSQIQGTAAGLLNRQAVMFYSIKKEMAMEHDLWKEANIVMQVHDELIVECPEEIALEVKDCLKICMEEAVTIPNVDFHVEPKIANNLADLK